MGTVQRTLWLPPVATALLARFAYGAGYDAEAGSRAGAEPTMAGIFFATPFVLVALAQAGCALLAALARTRTQVWACVAVSSGGAAALVLLAASWDRVARVDEIAVAGTLLSLVPALTSMAVEPSPGRGRASERQLDQRRSQA
jgi:hypothetical protein